MEKEENRNTTTDDHQEPEKEIAKPKENLDSDNKKEESAQEAKEEIKKGGSCGFPLAEIAAKNRRTVARGSVAGRLDSGYRL